MEPTNDKTNDGFRKAAMKEFSNKNYTIEEINSLSFSQSFLRLWIADYVMIVSLGFCSILLGACGMLIGGVNTPGGDTMFVVGGIIGAIAGLFFATKIAYPMLPKRHLALEEDRMSYLVMLILFTAIVGLIVGGLASDYVKLWFFPSEKRLPLIWLVGTITIIGGIAMSVVSIIWLAIKDDTRRALYLDYFKEWSQSKIQN